MPTVYPINPCASASHHLKESECRALAIIGMGKRCHTRGTDHNIELSFVHQPITENNFLYGKNNLFSVTVLVYNTKSKRHEIFLTKDLDNYRK